MNTESVSVEKPFDFQVFYQERERALGGVMAKMKRFMGRYVEQRLAELGFLNFKASYIGFLSNLEQDGITNNELARRAGVTKQAMSKIVKLLEDDGYIYIVKCERDSRSSQIFINERGKLLLAAVFNCMEELKDKFSTIAGRDRVEQMLDTMVLLVREIEKDTGVIPLPGFPCGSNFSH
ncbi:DNA-binding MarR family transcriptional regulator [Larkinella arboricola]|uniref:DNA-binding MarR family transcriptional regulator n=1 Tax=Larkinella arboricola TaxID=643671 RepID=A0A327X8D2_LARAB|nr:MarR family transcriptional regulator [Larkinella arboricola]RAK02143.1 DNA-binding MarR family transcriptional regulator [Larkinella arboricola]